MEFHQLPMNLKILITMMMNKKVYILFLFLLIIPVSAHGQTKDFAIWLGADVQHKLTKKLDLEFSGNFRTFNKSSQIDQEFIEGGLKFNINKNNSVAGSYRFINTLEKDDIYHIRHKFFLDLKTSVPYRNLNFSARLRIQRSSRTYIKDPEDEIPKYQSRLKFKTDYDFASFPLDPYAYAEVFLPIEKNKGFEIAKSRISAGAKLTISRRSSIDFEYIYQKDKRPDLINTGILSINYSLKI